VVLYSEAVCSTTQTTGIMLHSLKLNRVPHADMQTSRHADIQTFTYNRCTILKVLHVQPCIYARCGLSPPVVGPTVARRQQCAGTALPAITL
jgi:hypothetical protein